MSQSISRVALFAPSLRGGGAERVMLNLARSLSEYGVDVDLVLAKAEGPYLPYVPSNVGIVDLEAQRVAACLPGLIRYLKENRPQAILSTLDHANVIAILSQKLSQVSCRVLVRVATTMSVSLSNAGTLKQKVALPLLVRLLYPHADGIVAISQGVAEDLVTNMGLPENLIHVIYNPVVTPELVSMAQHTISHPWFSPYQPPVVLSVGRLTRAKDYSALIRAFALVRQRCTARLVILGEGEERDNLEVLIRELGLGDDVSMPGFVDNPYPYMARARVFVLSSAWEGFGNVLVEAMAVGTPIVATDCRSGPRETLEDGKWGRLVPVGDVEAMADAIIDTLAGDHAPPAELMQRAETFSLDRIAREYMAILNIRH